MEESIFTPLVLVGDVGVNPKIGGKTPKMDGENHGRPYEQMDDLGGKIHPYFWRATHVCFEGDNRTTHQHFGPTVGQK